MQHTLWTKNYTLLMVASALGAIGGIAGSFALSFLVFEKTGSTLASALILAIQVIPGFLIPTFLAPWMDRFPRKPFLVAGDLINGIFYGAAGIYLLYLPFNYSGYLAFSLLLACLSSFDSLAYNSIYPNLIPKGMEEKGYAISSMLYPVLNLMMMPLAALLMNTIGVAWILIGQGALSLLAALTESRIKLDEKGHLDGESYSFSMWLQDFKGGFAYLRKEKGLQSIYAYMAVTNGIAQGYGPILVAFFSTAPGFSSVMYALFSVAEFLGRSLGGLFSYHVQIEKKKKFGFAFLIYQIYEAMDMILLWLPYSLMLLNRGFIGFLGINSATMRQAAVQKYIPDEYRARINSLESVIVLAASSVLSLFVGVLGEVLDYRVCLSVCAMITLTVCWATIWRKRADIHAIYES